MDQQKLIRFLSLWIVSSIVLLVASALLSNNIVLGNDRLSKSTAGVISGFILTLIAHFVPKAVEKIDFKVKNEYAWQGVFLVANVIILWVIKRFALISGLGISNIFYVFILGVAITLAQWKALKVLKFLMSKK